MVAVAELWIYPVKSCRGISLEKTTVLPQGFKGDRQWMIVDPTGNFLTQRKYPQLARVVTALDEEYLTLNFENQKTLKIPTQKSGKLKSVKVWRNQTQAIDQGNEAAVWFSKILGKPCRLVRQSPDHIRPINPKYALWEDQLVSFADGYPVLLTNTASLTMLSEKLREDIPMNRFRPNLVIRSDEPFAEDNWSEITVNGLKFVAAKPCERCIVTTTDQQTGDRHPKQEPLKTLQTFRFEPKVGVLFGVNLMPTTTGEIQLESNVELL